MRSYQNEISRSEVKVILYPLDFCIKVLPKTFILPSGPYLAETSPTIACGWWFCSTLYVKGHCLLIVAISLFRSLFCIFNFTMQRFFI